MDPDPQPTLLRYGGGRSIEGLPTRADLVRANGGELTQKMASRIANRAPMFFMPVDVKEENDYSRGVPVYKLHLFGVLPDGSKAQVIIDDIDVYFDVRCEGAAGAFGAYLCQTLHEKNLSASRLADVEGFPIHGYHTAPVAWKRLHYPNTQVRRKAIQYVQDLGHETASDDQSSYYRVVARNYNLVLTDWTILSDYTYSRGGGAGGALGDRPRWARTPLCEHVFRASLDPAVGGIRSLVDPTASPEVQEKREAIKQSQPSLARDKTLVLTWDIETYSGSATGDLPRASRQEDCLFMICVTVHWKDSPEPLERICIVDIPTEPDGRWTTIVCGSEENVVRAFGVVYRHFAPDIITGFNDGGYDWPFLIETAEQHGALTFLAEMMEAIPRKTTAAKVLQFTVRDDQKIKIGAEEDMIVTYMKCAGCVPIDTRVMFKQLFPKAEVGKGSSLNFYLKACHLDSKNDMPHTRMWRIYRERDRGRMREVAHYCVVDAQRCQELLVKRNVINDRREVAALSYVSFYDAIYYAGGHGST